MDSALLKERELFKKRALATPVVETRKRPSSSSASGESKKKAKASSASSSSTPKSKSNNATKVPDPLAYKSLTGSSQYRFGILAKIVKYMKQRHLDGDTHPLSIDEILDETNQLDIGSKQKHWLVSEALTDNPKLIINEEGKYAYKPTYNLRDRRSLQRLLEKHDMRGLGGIYLEDIQESLHNADKALKLLGDSIVILTRPIDKRKVVFYNDKSYQLNVDEEFQKLWRSVAVDGLDESKIEEYHEKQGFSSMLDSGIKKPLPVYKKRKTVQRKTKNFKRLNDHMGDILKDYSDK
ncbi:hypothetical protein CHUAL_010984 [Chamberlinius hualienensis]